MPGIGFSELLILTALILVFFRTEDLPAMVKFVGKMWARGYRYYLVFKKELRKMEKTMGIEEEMKDIRAINAQLNSEVASFNRNLNKEISDDNRNEQKHKNEEKE